jgi:hypothetical protein
MAKKRKELTADEVMARVANGEYPEHWGREEDSLEARFSDGAIATNRVMISLTNKLQYNFRDGCYHPREEQDKPKEQDFQL